MSPLPEHPLNRATALVAVLCVLALTVFAASPGLHAGLHGHEAAAAGMAVGQGHDHPHDHGADHHGHGHGLPVEHAGHECAVTLFAGGVTALLVFCLLMLVRPLAAGVRRRAVDEIIPSLPRYRLVPSHAPPAV